MTRIIPCILVFSMLVAVPCPSVFGQYDGWRLYASRSVQGFSEVLEVNLNTGTTSQIFEVPHPGTNETPTGDRARDLLASPDGDILLYNGTNFPYLLNYDSQSGGISQTTYDGWSTASSSTYGGIARTEDTIFLSDMETGSGPEQGIIAVSIADNTFERFATGIGPEDINIGHDGLLYAIDGNADPAGGVRVYDPETYQLIDSIGIESMDYRGVAALADGTFFVAASNGIIRHYNPAGELINSMFVPGATFADIDINADGQIALGTSSDNEIVLTTTDLESFERFEIALSFNTTFVAWSAVPEPGILPLLGLAMLSLCRRNRGRSRNS